MPGVKKSETEICLLKSSVINAFQKKKIDQLKILTFVMNHVFWLILKRFLLVCPLEISFTCLLNVKTITYNAHL